MEVLVSDTAVVVSLAAGNAKSGGINLSTIIMYCRGRNYEGVGFKPAPFLEEVFLVGVGKIIFSRIVESELFAFC